MSPRRYRVLAEVEVADERALRAVANDILADQAVEPDPALTLGAALQEVLSDALWQRGGAIVDWAAVPEGRAADLPRPADMHARGIDEH